MTQDTTAATNILSLVNQSVELPTVPEILVKLKDVINDPDASAHDVAVVISKDPAVATNILRIVNSAYYGLQVRVSSVGLAVSVLGFEMTKKVALKAAVSKAEPAATQPTALSTTARPTADEMDHNAVPTMTP